MKQGVVMNREEYQQKRIKIKSFLNDACCEPQNVFLDHLCHDCYDWIRSSPGYIEQTLEQTISESQKSLQKDSDAFSSEPPREDGGKPTSSD